MTSLTDIIDYGELKLEVAAGNIAIRSHPDFPDLSIANYTDQCAFSRHWNDTTRTCRGLIWNHQTAEVLARPFPKFHNFDEPEAPKIAGDQVVWHWADKADGSLGILYQEPGGRPAIATRGSFQSEQAKLATKLLRASGLAWVYAEYIDSGYTPLFEIVGPSNRIVLSYAEDALIPLGYMHMGSGEFVPPRGAQSRTMASLLGDLSRSNAEGWVVWLNSREAVKIKQADYIELHRMVSNLTPKEVWRQLRAGTYLQYVERLPDELQSLAEEWATDLLDDFEQDQFEASAQIYQMRQYFGVLRVEPSRKDQAIWIQKNVDSRERGLVFSLLDGKDISDAIWRMLEPKG